MSKAKQVTVQAKIAGALVFDKTIDGKGLQHALMSECMRHMDEIGGSGVFRTQVVGARGWAVYTYKAGDNQAYLDTMVEF
jgi:hypothetical protein